MAEPGVDGSYGDLGRAAYDEEAQEWHFARDHGQTFVLATADDSEPALRSSHGTEDAHDIASQARQDQRLISTHPDLQPARALLHHNQLVSTAVMESVRQYDFVLGSRLSLGFLYDYGQNRPAPIIAWCCGQDGSAISLARVGVQRQGWNDSFQSWLNVPVPTKAQAYWEGLGSPIQQVVLARSTELGNSAPFLAVRMLDRTVILRLTLSKHGLDMYIVHKVAKDVERQAVHVDVAFNPWYPRQYAIVDMAGDWKVWQLDFKLKITSTVVATYHDEQHSSTELHIPQDGWRRIVWVGSATVIAVCSRRYITLYRIGDDIERLQDIDTRFQQPDCWILDIVVLPEMPSFLFVLTGVHLLAFEVVETHDGITVHRRTALRHHLNMADLTLHMKVFQDDADIVVLLSSRLNSCSLCYKLSDLAGTKPIVIGPSTSNAFVPGASNPACDLLVLPIRQTGQQFGGAMLADHQHSSNVFQVLYLKRDHDLGHFLAYALSSHTSSYVLRSPEWFGRLHNVSPNVVYDSFVVDDEHDLAPDPQRRPVSRFVQRLRQYPQGRQDSTWTIDLSSVVRLLHSPSTIRPDVTQILDRIVDFIRAEESGNAQPLRLLNSFARESTVTDVDEASLALQRLISLQNHNEESSIRTGYVTQQLHIPHVTAMQDLSDLAANYNHIISVWISPLATSVSGRIRLAKERLARQIAGEVTLASHTLRPQEMPVERRDAGEMPTYELDLPIRNVPVAATESATAAASTLPTPSPTATPSVLTQASQSAYAPQEYHITNVTTFSKALPVSLPKSTQRVLRHWEVGSDLSAYDWQSYSRRIAKQTEQEDLDSQLTQKERERLQRKAERLLKRERKEAAATRQQQVLSSQLPELMVSASQPAPRNTSYSQPQGAQVVPSSSQSQPVTASQAVQGRYGTRPKKKRKQGF